MPVGIYYTSKSFFNKTPDYTQPFNVVTNYYYKNNGDSFPNGKTFEVFEEINLKFEVFGFYDGVDINIEEGGYNKMDRLGKYPFISVRQGGGEAGALVIGPSAISIIASLAFSIGASISSKANKDKIWVLYFNKKQKLRDTSADAIGILLKGDKDFMKITGMKNIKQTKCF